MLTSSLHVQCRCFKLNMYSIFESICQSVQCNHINHIEKLFFNSLPILLEVQICLAPDLPVGKRNKQIKLRVKISKRENKDKTSLSLSLYTNSNHRSIFVHLRRYRENLKWAVKQELRIEEQAVIWFFHYENVPGWQRKGMRFKMLFIAEF